VFPPAVTQFAAQPWVLGLAGAAALVILICWLRRVLAVLIIGSIVLVAWLLDLPHLLGLLP
jgi:hypothetical protein